jgi:ElaB/YqjD/DUF883 family membrane-anchored ribosome-binding protein
MSANDLFRQAMDTFQSAIRTGVKIQEESTKRFTEMLRDFGSPLDWQKSTQSMMNEAIKATQKNIDESIRLMNHNAQTAMNLWQKAFENRSVQQLQEGHAAPSEELWESALGALRTNTQVILQANTRVLESWAQLARELTSRMEEQIHQTQEQVREQTQRMQEQAKHVQDQFQRQSAE